MCQFNQLLSEDLEKNTLMKFINIMYFVTVAGFTFVSFIWTKIHGNSTVKLRKDLCLIDINIKNLNIHLDYNYVRTSIVRFLVLGLLSINIYFLYLLLSQSFAHKYKAMFAYGLLYFGMLHHMSVICSYLTLIRTVSHIHEKMIEKTKTSLEHSKSNRKFILKRLMCIYHDLYGILKLVNSIFSAQILFSFALSFLLLTIQCYNIVSSIYNHSPYLKYSVAAIIYVSVGILEKFVIALVCHKCMFRNVVFKQTLRRYLALYSSDKSVTKEINAFGLQLLHEPFEIHAGNMFLIDLPIFTSICGTASTYIILLWQTDSKVDINYSMKKVFGVF
ncbi:gustatory receptor 8a-like [Tribolium madens]|uniref:gustatory receptor 8a-like n=1 Tax=Tribolium madens TaxID=41895 RepID=UPI001CF764CE|nr:gustatory receptor 8a-like [Tribolium madens]